MKKNKLVWLSYHIFCHNSRNHDAIIWILDRWCYKENIVYFFIRYWEGGPHIRFRIKGDRLKAREYYYKIHTLLASELSDNNINLTKNQYYANHKLDGIKIDIESLPWYKNNSIVLIPYVREYERYGGKNLIGQAEIVFYYSSQLVSKMLGNFTNCHIIFRILFFIYIYNQVNISIKKRKLDFDFEKFFDNCYRYWNNLYNLKDEIYVSDVAKFIKEIFEKKEEKIESIFSFIKEEDKINFIESLIKYIENVYLCKGAKMSRSVLFSQMHMFANRLGIPIESECAVYKYYYSSF